MFFLIFIVIINTTVLSREIKLFDKTDKELSLYLFSNETSCGICLADFDYLLNSVDTNKVSITHFYQSESKNLPDALLKYSNMLNHVSDELGVYQYFYNIKKDPYLILADSKGEVIYEFKLGSHRENESILNVIEYINNFESNDKILKLISRDKIKYKSNAINIHKFSTARLKDSILFINDSRNYKYFKINLNNYNVNEINMNQDIDYNFSRNPDIDHNETIWNFDISYDYGHFAYNIANNNLNYFIIDSLFENKSYYPSPHFIIVNNYIYLGIEYKNKYDFINGDNPSIIKFNILDNFQDFKTLGRINNDFSKFKKSNLMESHLAYTKSQNKLYEFQNSTKQLHIYDYTDNLLDKYELKFGNNYRWFNYDLKDYNQLENGIFNKNNYSLIIGTLLNDKTKTYSVIFNNKYIPDDAKSLRTARRKESNFIHIFDLMGNSIFESDIELPINFMPFLVTRNIMEGTEIIDGELFIAKYSIQSN